MQLKVIYRQHLRFLEKTCPSLIFPDPNGIFISITQAQNEKDLGIRVNSSQSRAPHLLVFLYSAMVQPYLR